MHIAAILSVAALAFRDELRLRLVLLASILFSILQNSFVVPGPAWQELFWNGVLLVINLTVTVNVLRDRTHIGLDAEEEELFEAFGTLTPGEFRSLMRLGRRHSADSPVELTREGERPESLFYVLHGDIEVTKAGRNFVIPPRTFVGEVAFLHGDAASATVILAPGARYVAWTQEALRRGMDSKAGLHRAVWSLIGFDMARKVAAS